MKHVLLSLLLFAFVAGNAADPSPELLHSILGDSINIENKESTAVMLDSVAMLPGRAGNVAAGVALLLRGNHDLGLRTLQVAVDAAAQYHPSIVLAADLLVSESHDTDSLSEAYVGELRRKAQYLAKIDSIDPALNVKLAQLTRHSERHSHLWLYLLLVPAFIIGVLAGVFLTRRFGRRKKISAPIDAINRPDGAKAMLQVAIASMNRLRELTVLVERKLAAGQSKDLYQSITSGKVEDANHEAFSSSFDRAWHTSFPDFEARLNELLKPDKSVEVGETLTPELRICALISMGVENSQELSQLLGLSVNTVYTYRNRMKGRALDRENFEKDIKKAASNLPIY